jgi:hypothetical protein
MNDDNGIETEPEMEFPICAFLFIIVCVESLALGIMIGWFL